MYLALESLLFAAGLLVLAFGIRQAWIGKRSPRTRAFSNSHTKVEISVHCWNYVSAFWAIGLGMGILLLLALAQITSHQLPMFILGLVWLTLLLWIGELVPVWVRRSYTLRLCGDNTTVRFIIWGGDWEVQKLFWWSEDGSGFWLQHIRDISHPVRYISLNREALLNWDGGEFRWELPGTANDDFRLDPRFSAARRSQSPIFV